MSYISDDLGLRFETTRHSENIPEKRTATKYLVHHSANVFPSLSPPRLRESPKRTHPVLRGGGPMPCVSWAQVSEIFVDGVAGW